MRDRRTVAALAASIVVVAAAMAGCGGSSPSSATTSASAQASSPGSAAATRHGEPKIHATAYSSSGGTLTHSLGRQNSTATTAAATQNPCTLVSRATAEKVLGVPVLHEREAPLGPTCVLAVKGRTQYITISVQSIDVAREIAQMKPKPAHLTIGGHSAYCGRLGTTLLLVELPGGMALQVAAPCAAAEALAAKALPRITP